MAQRDELGGFLRSHDTGDLSDAEDVALLHTSGLHKLEALAGHAYAPLGHGAAGRDVLRPYVDHERVAVLVDVSKAHHCHLPKPQLGKWHTLQLRHRPPLPSPASMSRRHRLVGEQVGAGRVEKWCAWRT